MDWLNWLDWEAIAARLPDMKSLLDLLLRVVTLISAAVGGLWAYTKFIVERGLLPPVQFDVDCRRIGDSDGSVMLDIGLHLKNLGSSTLVARNLRLDVCYRDGELPGPSFHKKLADGSFRTGPGKALFLRGPGRAGRLVFPGCLAEDLGLGPEAVESGSPEKVVPPPRRKRKVKPLTTRGLPILAADAFVQPNVDQRFGFVTALPAHVSMVLVWGAFEYAQRPSVLQHLFLWLSRRLGLVQFTLAHIRRPHTVERVFEVG